MEMIEAVILAFLGGGGVGGIISYLSTRQQIRRQYEVTDNMKKTIIKILSDENFPVRRFNTIKSHFSGVEEDKIREALIRCNAISLEDTDGNEIWGLRANIAELIGSPKVTVTKVTKGGSDGPNTTGTSRKSGSSGTSGTGGGGGGGGGAYQVGIRVSGEAVYAPAKDWIS